MKSRMLFLLKLSSCLLAIPLVAQAGPVGTATPRQPTLTAEEAGAWAARDMVVGLSHLPKLYSCDDLEEHFRDVLLALGARPDLKIQAYECRPASEGYSPRVHLQFALPSSLLKSPTVTVDAARPRTVRLGPGITRSWTREDCELMRQVKDELLPKVSPKVVSFSLACDAAPVNSEHYNVTVQAIEPVSASSRVATVANVAPTALPR